MLHIPGLYILDDEQKGRSVFTSLDIADQSIIEICPLIIFSHSDLKKIHETKMHDYYFIWDDAVKSGCIALGYGSLYNHSPTPNALVIKDFEDNTIKIQSTKDIEAFSEVTIDYTDGNPKATDIWFDIK